MRRAIAVIAVAVATIGFTGNPVGAMDNPSDDYCKRGTFDSRGYTVVCEDDYSCVVVLRKLRSGDDDCWFMRTN